MELNNTDTKILSELPLYFFLCLVIASQFLNITCPSKWLKILQWTVEKDFSEDTKNVITFWSCLYLLDRHCKEHAAKILRSGLHALEPYAHIELYSVLSSWLPTWAIAHVFAFSIRTCVYCLAGCESSVSSEIIFFLLSLSWFQ